MKISIYTGYPLVHPEVDIRCNEKNSEVQRIENAIRSCEQYLSATIGEKTVYLKPSQVLYFEVVDRITFAYTKEETAIVKMKLNELTSDIFYGYFRISKSMVVNINHIKNIVRCFNGNLDITLDNGEHITMSRRYVPEFNSYINWR